MIQSKSDYNYYLEADHIALSKSQGKGFYERLKNFFFPDYIWLFQKALRRVEYYKNCKEGIFAKFILFFVYWRFKKLSNLLGFTIPPNVFGPGLSIAHSGTIIINGGAKIGSNCRLHAGVNIGTEAGYSGRAPQIGDNCYIGPGAKIFGDINIADGVAIGANAVVNKSFNNSGIVIAGIPAKKISDIDTKDLTIPATEIIEMPFIKSEDISGIPAKKLNSKLKKLSKN